MSEPVVSCIVPVYNGERYLAETLESVRAQTWTPIELIVVDDGSSDRSAEIARRYCDVLIASPNRGPAAARNQGLAGARGSFVAFLDADDVWHPEKIARQLARFGERPELAVTITHIVNFLSPELGLPPESIPDGRREAVPGYVVQTLLARREAFARIGGFDGSLGLSDGTDWFIRAREAKLELEVLPEVLVRRRLHGASISQKDLAKSHEEHLRLIKAALDRRRQRPT